jgi:hypothetical protein
VVAHTLAAIVSAIIALTTGGAVIFFLGGLIAGLVESIAQASVLRRYSRVSSAGWIIATTLSTAVAWLVWAFIAAALIVSSLNQDITGTQQAGTPSLNLPGLGYVLAVVVGITIGLASALAQWWVLRRHVTETNSLGIWLLFNSIGWATGALLLAVILSLGASGAGNLSLLTGEAWVVATTARAAITGAGTARVLRGAQAPVETGS